jgi:hypothetical protein
MAGVGSSLQKLLGIVKARPLSTAVVVLAAWPLSLFLLPILLPAAVLAVVGLFLMPARFQGTSARSAPGSVQLQELPVREPEAGARAANGKEETATAGQDEKAGAATEKAASAASGVSGVAGSVGTAGIAGVALAAGNQAEGNKKAPGVAQQEKAPSNAAKQEKEVAAAAPTKDDGLDWNFPKAGERSASVCGSKDPLASWERI